MKASASAIAVLWFGAFEALAAETDSVYTFDIPTQNAEESITSLAAQSNRQIFIPGDYLNGIRTPKLHGTFSVDAALSTLLKDTPLEVASDDGNVIVLRPRGAPPSGTPSPSPAAYHDATETVVVTGYRASLTNAADAKKGATNFVDSIFAEDIGKFPDTNLAEAINRIPGILLSRDTNGEGVQVSIRGLDTNFTKILLNDAQIAVATGGVTDSSNSNRGVDLNLFPGELFRRLQVTKSTKADILEGGAAGTIDMRTLRPFDNEGFHFDVSAHGIDHAAANGLGGNGTAIVSTTWDTKSFLGQAGILVGVAAKHDYNYTTGWEDGNAGWVTPSVTNATLCGAASGCDIAGSTVSIGGNAIAIATTIPSNVAIPASASSSGTTYAAGTPVTAAMLLDLNPGITMTQISNMLLPRMPRSMYQRGARNTYNADVSFELRPTDDLELYADVILVRRAGNIDRSDMNWGVRAGYASQPMLFSGVTLDANGVVTGGTFYNAQFALEARRYRENADFASIDAGMIWRAGDLFTMKFQLNSSRSHFLRDSPTILLVTCPSVATSPGCTPPVGGVTVTFENHGRSSPRISTNIALDDPENFQFSGGLMQGYDDKRYTSTYGARLDVAYGGEQASIELGASYDASYRSIVGLSIVTQWTTAACGGGTSVTCTGADGSLITQSELAQYLYQGPAGFVTVNYDTFFKDSGYNALHKTALETVRGRCAYQEANNSFSTGTNTNAMSSCVDERTVGIYAQGDGTFDIAGGDLRYDFGLRWVQTRQSISSPKLDNDTSTYTFSSAYSFSTVVTTYQAFLPSANAAYNVTDDFVVRAAVSRTITRANIAKMISVVNFSDITAQMLQLGNPDLKPYFSNNLDIGFEYYTGGPGYISVSLFGKWISGFTVSQNVTRSFQYLRQFGITWNSLTSTQQAALYTRAGCTSDDNCDATITVTQEINAPGIEEIKGFELSYALPLDFAIGRYDLHGFGLTANMTVIAQSSSGSAATHATGVAPLSYNLTGYYERNGLMARLSYAFRNRMYGTGSNAASVCLPNTLASESGCPGGAYMFSASYGQADLSSSIELSSLFGDIFGNAKASFDIQNLFNDRQHSYFQYQNAYHSQYVAQRTFIFGISSKF